MDRGIFVPGSLPPTQGDISMTADLTSALEAWRAAIGSDRVTDDDNARRRAGQATFATPNAEVLAILRPASAEEVQIIARLPKMG